MTRVGSQRHRRKNKVHRQDVISVHAACSILPSMGCLAAKHVQNYLNNLLLLSISALLGKALKHLFSFPMYLAGNEHRVAHWLQLQQSCLGIPSSPL
jgi:hypothetical protein